LIRYQIRSAARNTAAERGKTKPNKNNLQIKSLPTEKLCARIMRAASVRLGRPAGTFRAFVFRMESETNRLFAALFQTNRQFPKFGEHSAADAAPQFVSKQNRQIPEFGEH
jgi:menaquinone-dependent protoporphyrinogen IX oxidase